MTYKTLIALIFRIAGLLLFIEFFNHFGNHFLAVFAIDHLPLADDNSIHSFHKYYYTSLIIGILNLVVSWIFIFKADQLSNKIVKQDRPLNIELTPKTLIRSVIILFGVLWMGKSIYLIPTAIQWIIIIILKFTKDSPLPIPEFSILTYIIKIILAYFFIFKTDKIINLLKKRSSIDFIENENTPL